MNLEMVPDRTVREKGYLIHSLIFIGKKLLKALKILTVLCL